MTLTRTTCTAFAAATAPSLYAVVLEPPTTMVKALGSFGRHFDPTVAVAMAWGTFSPPQLDTSTAKGARR